MPRAPHPLQCSRDGVDPSLAYAGRPTLPINAVADQYLRAFRENAEFEGGLNFRQALTQSKLDFSVGSLERVDILLDQIRARFAPEPDQFIADQRNVNFLCLLAFYVGEVVARASGAAIEWLQYDEMIERIPSNRAFFPYCFGSSVTCILSRGPRTRRSSCRWRRSRNGFTRPSRSRVSRSVPARSCDRESRGHCRTVRSARCRWSADGRESHSAAPAGHRVHSRHPARSHRFPGQFNPMQLA